jgi:hypothetical protein
MIQEKLKMIFCVATCIAGVGTLPVTAELPSLGEKKWLGHFIGFENKKFSYGFTVQGKSLIKVVGMKGEPLMAKLAIQVDFVLEEILPNGKMSVRPIIPESLESSQPAGNDPKNLVIRGKVKGDATFEVSVNEDHGLVSLGGHLVDKGALVKNPIRFSIHVKFPNAYPYTKRDGDKKRKDAFEEKIRNDRMSITWTDGKRINQATDKSIDASSKDVNGPGISALQVEFSSYAGKKIDCVASVNSTILLSSEQAAPLHDGFLLTWITDPVKDPEGQAKLSLGVR